jgi:hypothetical protein
MWTTATGRIASGRLLAKRVPAFAEVKMVRAWAGLFELNTLG